MGAISGNAKVMNRGGMLGRGQHIEYVLGFDLDRGAGVAGGPVEAALPVLPVDVEAP